MKPTRENTTTMFVGIASGLVTCGILEECTDIVLWQQPLYALAVASTSAAILLYVVPRIIAAIINKP